MAKWSAWVLSEEHQQEYRVLVGDDGQSKDMQWKSQEATGATVNNPNPNEPRSTPDSASLPNEHSSPVSETRSAQNYTHNSPSAAGPSTESSTRIQASVITEPPTEQLEASFAVVRARHQDKFYQTGRVFAILWTEPAGGNGRDEMGDAFSIVRFAGTAHTEIRRFIVAKAYDWHSICVPILSYRKNGAGGRPDVAHHSVAFTTGTAPSPLEDEAINRHPIKIDPRPGERLNDKSRINFAKMYTVEHNLKVKPIGKVADEWMPWFLRYFEDSCSLGNK